MSRDGRLSCSFVLHIKNPLFVRCILYTMGSWVSSEFFWTLRRCDLSMGLTDSSFDYTQGGGGLSVFFLILGGV
jgi:hypothetical protein